jgi:hypothetical protein
MDETPPSPVQTVYAAWLERSALWLLVALMAWAQFPLGSNRPWSWSFLVLLVAFVWTVWTASAVLDPQPALRAARRHAVPGLLLLAVLGWVWLQSETFMPADWKHPVWNLVAHAFGRHVPGTISIDPDATRTEWMKLASYVALGWLAAVLAERYENARTIYVAVFAIGVAYAVYGITLSALGTSQATILEGMRPPYGRDVSGAFVAKNSFATFTGIALLAGLPLLVEAGRHQVVAARGWRTHMRTLIQFAVGRGAVWLIGSLILLGALIASDSRAGLIATLVGLVAMFVLALAIAARRQSVRWTLTGGAAAALAILGLFLLNGQNVQSRFENLIETSGSEEIRPEMWNAAYAGLLARPYTGTGLGTYRDVYSLYANSFIPYVVDRAHNDLLEFPMGVGLPAAGAWYLAFLILAIQCARGVLRRHRRRIYAMTAVGATVLVTVHSLFDFSLQMPAVAVLFAAILGVGLGQCMPTRADTAKGTS